MTTHITKTQAKPTLARVEVITVAPIIANRRSEVRYACQTKGLLVLLPRHTLIECGIVDQSASGAKVMLDPKDIRAGQAVWLIDLENDTVKQGMVAWGTTSALGLKFTFSQKLTLQEPRPQKVPADVYCAWFATKNNDSKSPAEAFFLD